MLAISAQVCAATSAQRGQRESRGRVAPTVAAYTVTAPVQVIAIVILSMANLPWNGETSLPWSCHASVAADVGYWPSLEAE